MQLGKESCLLKLNKSKQEQKQHENMWLVNKANCTVWRPPNSQQKTVDREITTE